MAKKTNTLNELNLYLENNTEVDVLNSTENFIEKKAVTLAKVDYFTEKVNYTKPVNKPKYTSIELADYIHSKAKEENKSFAEIWLDVLEEGAKKEMLIPFDKAIRTWVNVPIRSFTILKESINTMFRI